MLYTQILDVSTSEFVGTDQIIITGLTLHTHALTLINISTMKNVFFKANIMYSVKYSTLKALCHMSEIICNRDNKDKQKTTERKEIIFLLKKRFYYYLYVSISPLSPPSSF